MPSRRRRRSIRPLRRTLFDVKWIVVAALIASVAIPDAALAQNALPARTAPGTATSRERHRHELEALAHQSSQATYFYVVSAVLGGAGVPALVAGAVLYGGHIDDIGGIVTMLFGGVSSLFAIVYLCVAVAYDTGAAERRARLLRETRRSVDIALSFAPDTAALGISGAF
jgi:hypothetical protein